MTIPANFNTPDRVIRLAMKDAGLLQDGDDPTPEQYADNLGRLIDMVNLWQTQGLKLWLQFDLAVPLVAGQSIYTIGPGGSVDMAKPLRVVQGYYLDGGNWESRRPLIALSQDEFTRLSNVAQGGSVNSYYVDKQRDVLQVHFWMTPNTQAAEGVCHLIIQRQVTHLVSLNDQIDFPQEWFLAVRWGLADEICTGQPQAIMNRCATRANAYRSILDDWDVEDVSTTFQPDSRMTHYAGRFR